MIAVTEQGEITMRWNRSRAVPTASATALPASARCSPGARPGSTLPVVGVWPWRTSSTRVDGGSLGLARRRGRVGADACADAVELEEEDAGTVPSRYRPGPPPAPSP